MSALPASEWRHPRLASQPGAATGLTDAAPETAPSWRGWVLSLLGCAVLAAVIPYADLIIRSTRLTFNLLPATSLVFVFVLILAFNLGLARARAWLRLSRADLVLVFCTTMLVNSLPGAGLMNWVINAQLGLSNYATPENAWRETLFPLIPEDLTVRDPVIVGASARAGAPSGAASEEDVLRPAEWFYTGMQVPQETRGRTIVTLYRVLAPSFIRWCLGALFAFLIFFGLAALWHRQWTERERLPFPLAQVPDTMLDGLFNGGGKDRPFALDRLAWAGLLVVFLLHGYNALGGYLTNWAPVPLKNDMRDYLSEPPWSYLRPMHCHIFPSVVAFMFLVSREVSFSLWFFYLVVLKIGVAIASGVFGLGIDGWYFTSGEGTHGIFVNQGVGALVVMVLAGIYMARGMLWNSLKQAAGVQPADSSEPLSPRLGWSLLAAGAAGLFVWLVWFGMRPAWAGLMVVFIALGSIGVARVVSEGGMLFVRGPSATGLLHTCFTPVELGAKDSVLAGLYGKVFEFETFRMNPLTSVMSALHLGSLSRVKLKPMLLAMGVAVPVTLAVAFFSYYFVCYSSPSGAKPLGWSFSAWAPSQYREKAVQAKRIQGYEAAVQAGRSGAGRGEYEEVARRDNQRLGWTGVGAAAMAAFLLLRTRVFWWPHPIGYVMWMAPQPMYQMWFSYLLGWAIKTLLLKFGGQRAFARGKRFFVGLIIGEALATICWIIIAALSGKADGYSIEYN